VSELKKHYIAEELVDLPGMPKSKTDSLESKVRAIQHMAQRESWTFQKLPGRGGPRGFAFSSLPLQTREYLKKQSIIKAPAIREAAPVPASIDCAPLPALTELTKRQVAVMDARVRFMRVIESRHAGYSIKKTIQTIVDAVAEGDQNYTVMAAAANDRQGIERKISDRTILRWWSAWNDSNRNPAALAPNDADAQRVARDAVLVKWAKEYKPGSRLALPPGIPEWLPYLLDEFRLPSSPDLAEAHRSLRRILPRDINYPTYNKVHKLYKKIPVTILEKGRKTGAEFKALLGYATRDASMDDPFTICQIDGHSLKAYVAHPTTGAHFHPEVCGIICLTTKALGGWSTGLAESNQTVADAVRHLCTVNEQKPFGSVPAIVEPDRGSGNLAKVNSDELTGRFSRLGITFLPPERGGNPQGHGAIERSNQSIWIRAAKSLVTYTGKDMDRVTRKRVYTKLERDLEVVVKAGKLGEVEKTSELLMSWREFLAWLDEWAMEYNNTPHSALPKITCQQTGRRRHMTPLEALASRISQGWQPVVYPELMLPYLFMPHEQVTVKRQGFTLHGNKYHAYELVHYHSQDVIVAFDVHDAKEVWVLDMDERPICKAQWNGNRVHAQPKSVKDQAIHNRKERRLKNLDNKARMIRGEAKESAVIEHSAEILARCAPLEIEHHAPVAVPQARAIFTIPTTQSGKYRYWGEIAARITQGEEVGDDEKRFYTSYQKTASWQSERMFDASVTTAEHAAL
jgi:putative transposase